MSGVRLSQVKVGTVLRDPEDRLWEVQSMNWAVASPPDQIDVRQLLRGVDRPARGERRRLREEDLAGWTVAARGKA